MTTIKSIFAILLCFTLGMTPLFTKPSYAIASEQQAAFSAMFLTMAIVSAFIVLSMMHINATKNSEVVGWIEANKTLKYSPSIQIIPRFYFTIQILENSLVYRLPNKKQDAIGYVYKGEEYRVKKETLLDNSLWYEIKINLDHSSSNN